MLFVRVDIGIVDEGFAEGFVQIGRDGSHFCVASLLCQQMGIVSQIEKGSYVGVSLTLIGGLFISNIGSEPIHLPGGLVNGLLLCGVESEESVGEALGGTDNGIELGGTDEFVVTIFPVLFLTPIAFVFKTVIGLF